MEQSKIIDLEGKNVVSEKTEVKKQEEKCCPFGSSVVSIPYRDRLGQTQIGFQQVSSFCMKDKCKFYNTDWKECQFLLKLSSKVEK